MKKLAIGIFANLLLTVSCQKNENHQSTATISVTLNGINQTDAAAMIRHFDEERFNDANPTKTNVWFDRTTIERMYNLVKAEGGDGIRIYFISDLNTSGPSLRNSIALVSTKANGKSATAPSGMRHRDYYEHAANNPLFSNLKSINGAVTYGAEKNNTVLYTTCDTCAVETQNSTNHHHITRQFAEKMAQGFGKHFINTISEWFDLDLFDKITKDGNSDGVRIYFGTKPKGADNSDRDGFVLIKTAHGITSGTHVDYFGSQTDRDGGQDNGEQCQYNCN
jgi:hypothetical protein